MLVKIFQISKFSKILISFKSFEEPWFSSIFSKNLDFGKNFENVDFGQNFRKISILVKILGILDLFKQSWFWPKLSNYRILSKIVVNYLDFGQNFRKSWFWSKFIKFFILVKIFENVHFRQNFRKILISVNFFFKSWHWSKFLKNLDFSLNFRKSRFL